jgi:hypothetical protein
MCSCLQNLSSCIVVDNDDSADETPVASTATSVTKTKSDLMSSLPTDTHITKKASAADYSQSFSGSGICNPGFNFEDDEIDENGGELDGPPETRNHQILYSDSLTSKDLPSHQNVEIQMRETVKTIFNNNDANPDIANDTDEDAASLSISTVSEASTVVPGDSFQAIIDRPPAVPEKKKKHVPSRNAPLVSQIPIGRRTSVKTQRKLASGEGNVKIVEIKSRDVVQGILRMQPNLGGSLSGKDHIAIVKVPVTTSQNMKKQMRPSVNANARQAQASSNCGSGPSQESRDGKVKKVRLFDFK